MRVLLVDHDAEGLEAIARAIRGVLELDCVTSKGDALLLLRQNAYDVLIACERAVDGSGLDLLGRTTRTAVPLKRIFAAAPERLQLLGPRLAPFKVQRTINYPIDLEELWLAIAQVTGGPNDETDGTIERVVLDERGIPASGTTPRAPIPPRPPAPLGGVRTAPAPAPAPVPAIAVAATGARAATARMTQPVPEPPLRAPPPPRAPPARQATPAAQMRAAAPAMHSIPPMPMPPQLSSVPAPRVAADWTPEQLPPEDDFAQVAAQARLGVQRKVVDEASRRKRQRLLTASLAAVVVAGVIVFLIEKFYDPAARAREQAIAAEVTRMTEQQKVTDNLTLIEIDIEKAIMSNDLAAARSELARLVEKSPAHPRREFLEASINRAAELQKLAAQGQGTAPAAVIAAPTAPERARPRVAERAPARVPERVAERAPERSVVASRPQRDTAPASSPRTYGAPISEPPRTSTIALDSPINSAPTLAPARHDNNFSGRTVEASDSAVGRTGAPQSSLPGPSAYPPASGSAVAVPPVAPPAAQSAPAPVDVTPAKILKRVTPVVAADVARKTSGFVVVKFDIGENGRVNNVTVVESTPPGVFDDAALSAVRKWVYEPRKENGVAVGSQAKARLVFEVAK
ncbi:MAG TPA: TonB family protein [Steroidobacteraceae bacterium]|jgi:TonB family protein|nr:TonB family protein [Steroidobacteraceae bacterium]